MCCQAVVEVTVRNLGLKVPKLGRWWSSLLGQLRLELPFLCTAELWQGCHLEKPLVRPGERPEASEQGWEGRRANAEGGPEREGRICEAVFALVSRKSKSPPKVPIVIQDDSLPAGPPPQIRILKRPTSNGVVNSPNATSRPALPVKSLAQREAEYAEARKRILGSASPEEEQEKPTLDR